MLEAKLFARHLEEDETVSMVVHKHWLRGLKALTLPTMSILLSLAVLSGATAPVALYVVAAWSLLSAVWWARAFFDYYLDAWLVTNMGIIDLEWRGWFHRQSSRVLYSDVQGVSYKIKGILGTLLRYGDLGVEKISTGSAVSLSHVPNPRAVEALILRNMEAYLHSKNLKDAGHIQELLATMVAEQVQLKDLRAKKPAAEAEEKEEPEFVEAIPRRRGFHSSKIRGSRHA
jgi:hypothetical protein